MADDKPRVPDMFQQIGRPGVKRSGHYIAEEFLTDLVGRRAALKYREMFDNSPIIGGMMYCVGNLLRSIDYRWEAASDKSEDGAACDFIQEEWEQLENPWSTNVDQVAYEFPFGYALGELVYRRRPDGKVGWKDIVFLAQESFHQWEYVDDDPVAWTQLPPSDYIQRTVPLSKCLHFRTTRHKNNPAGRSVLRNAYTSYYYLNRLQELEAIGIERDLAGLPVLKIPLRFMATDASSDEKAFYEECKRIIRNVRRDEHEGVILPSDTNDQGHPLMELVLLSTGSRRQGGGTNEVIVRYEQRMAMSMLADFILLGHEKVGSFALSSDKTDLFALALGSYLKDIVGTVEKQGSDKLLAINGMKGKAKLVPGDFQKGDVAALMTSLGAAVKGGVIHPDPALEGWARELLAAPKPDKDFINAQGQQTSGGPGALPGGAAPGNGPGPGQGPGPGAVDPATLRQRGGSDPALAKPGAGPAPAFVRGAA